ncbi:MAG: signal peptidase I [Polyangia bacterium]
MRNEPTSSPPDATRKESAAPAARQSGVPRWHRAVAAAVSLVIPGGGQLALGRLRRALILLLAYVGLVAVGALSGRRGLLVAGIAGAGLIRLGGAVDVARLAPGHRVPPWWQTGPLWLALFIMLSAGSGALRQHVLESYSNPSGSMMPTMQVGDRFFVFKRAGAPRHGDVYAFRTPQNPNTVYVKRLIGLPGDRVTICGSEVRLDDQPLRREPLAGSCQYEDSDPLDPTAPVRHIPCVAFREWIGERSYTVIHNGKPQGLADLHPECRTFQVPAESAFVLGDNRDNSFDSRHLPAVYVPYPLLVGRAWFIWYSGGREGVRWERFLSLLQTP